MNSKSQRLSRLAFFGLSLFKKRKSPRHAPGGGVAGEDVSLPITIC